jgi:hypothetical protein
MFILQKLINVLACVIIRYNHRQSRPSPSPEIRKDAKLYCTVVQSALLVVHCTRSTGTHAEILQVRSYRWSCHRQLSVQRHEGLHDDHCSGGRGVGRCALKEPDVCDVVECGWREQLCSDISHPGAHVLTVAPAIPAQKPRACQVMQNANQE